jgi:capsular polysaccharide biosynthesis protein
LQIITGSIPIHGSGTEALQEYESNITFKRTEYMAVKISVLDKDPQLAADIANTIAALLDSVKNDMQKERLCRDTGSLKLNI